MSLEKRKLGNTGLQISCLGLGTVKIGRNQKLKYSSNFPLPTDTEVTALLDQASELGINFLDTAPAYGSSEQRLGRLLNSRDKWIVCSKVGEEFTNGKSFFDFSAKHTRHSIERSLRNIRSDYLDIVLIHSDGKDLQILESSDCAATLRKMQDEGLIRAVGMSTKTVAGGLKAAELLDVVMVTYNPSMLDEEKVIDRAAELDVGVLIKKALNIGHHGVPSQTDDNSDPINLTQRNLNFALNKKGVTSVVMGTINPLHLKENIQAVQ